MPRGKRRKRRGDGREREHRGGEAGDIRRVNATACHEIVHGTDQQKSDDEQRDGRCMPGDERKRSGIGEPLSVSTTPRQPVVS